MGTQYLGPRYPVEPLLFLAGVTELAEGVPGVAATRAGAVALALFLAGFCSREAGHQRVSRARVSGGFRFEEADEAAVALGYHPAEVWPEWVDA